MRKKRTNKKAGKRKPEKKGKKKVQKKNLQKEKKTPKKEIIFEIKLPDYHCPNPYIVIKSSK